MDPPPRSCAADAHDCIIVPIPSDRPNTSLWRDRARQWRAPLGSSCRHSQTLLTARPVDIKACGYQGLWIYGRSASPTGCASRRFPSKLEKRGNAHLRPHTHRHHSQPAKLISMGITHATPLLAPKAHGVAPLDTKSPIQVRGLKAHGGAVLLLARSPGRASADASDGLSRRHSRRWWRLSSGRPNAGPGGRVQRIVRRRSDCRGRLLGACATQILRCSRRHRLTDRQGSARSHRPTRRGREDHQPITARPATAAAPAPVKADCRGIGRLGRRHRAPALPQIRVRPGLPLYAGALDCAGALLR